MGNRGPLPKSAFSEATKAPKGVGLPPAHLNKQAKLYYTYLADLLSDRLEPEDETILAECAQAMAEIAMVNATFTTVDDYMTMGAQGPGVHPLVRVRTLAQKQFLAASAKLGLSPSDRHRLMGNLKPEGDQTGGPADFDKDGGDSA